MKISIILKLFPLSLFVFYKVLYLHMLLGIDIPTLIYYSKAIFIFEKDSGNHMKRSIFIPALLLVFLLLICGCSSTESEETLAETTTVATTQQATESTTLPPETEATLPPVVLELSEEDTQMLLKIGMAELGHTECETCIAMVMCTVLNRVKAGGFGRSIYGVLHAQDQFTPVMDGSFSKAEPNDACYAALDMVIRGWDETQGALYYEFCEGESWHSKNLQLLTEHCNTRFYK